MTPRTLPVFLALLVSLIAQQASANWPSFRGPQGTGVSPSGNPPIEWSEAENVLWKVPLDGVGHASPVVWGDRIYVLSAQEIQDDGKQPETAAGGERSAPARTHRFAVAAHDLATGARIWRTVVREVVPHESLHTTASQASSSPVTDGERVWAFFGSRGLYCLGHFFFRRALTLAGSLFFLLAHLLNSTLHGHGRTRFSGKPATIWEQGGRIQGQGGDYRACPLLK